MQTVLSKSTQVFFDLIQNKSLLHSKSVVHDAKHLYFLCVFLCNFIAESHFCYLEVHESVTSRSLLNSTS